MDPRDLLIALLSRMPLGLADKLAWLLAYVWWWVVPVRKRVAVHNLRAALPELAPRPVLTRMMHDIILSYIEILQFDRLSIRCEGFEAVRANPGVVVAGHFGAWDILVLASCDRLPVSIFFRRPTNAWARRLIEGLRAAHHVGGLPDKAGMSDAYRALEEGRNVYFVQDQHYARGIPSPFFGRPALTATGFAAAALKSGRPAWCQYQWREGVGRHATRIAPFPMPPLSGDPAVDVQRVTDATNAWFAERIRERPHGWLWLHQRWK